LLIDIGILVTYPGVYNKVADRRRDRIELEKFYYSAIYSALKDTTFQTNQAIALKKVKAKIIRPNSEYNLGMLIDNGEQDRIMGEEAFLHHLLKIRNRQAQRTVHEMHDMKIQEALNCFEEASGAKVIVGKSRALGIGKRDTSVRIIDIPIHSEAKLLGFHITSKVLDSAHKSWTITTAQIHAHDQDAYNDLNLYKRIQCVHDYLMAKIWYIAKTYPQPDECVRQLNTTIRWYVWREEIFRVPLSTLQRRKGEGRWDLIHITAKNCALFLYHLRQQGLRSGTPTAEWLRS